MKKYLWIILLGVVLIVIFYIFQLKVDKLSDTEIVKTYQGSDFLTVKDVPKITYPIYLNDNGKYGSLHNLKFKEMGKSNKLPITRVGEGDNAIEYFWINNYRFDEDNLIKVFILGDYGGDTLDVRVFDVSKINGELKVIAEPSL